MKKLINIISYLCCFFICNAQNTKLVPSYVGAYFSWQPEFGHYRSDGTQYTLWENTYNLNAGYQLSKRWKVGAEVMLIDVKGEYAPSPFFLGGLHSDYDFIHTPLFNFALRGGISSGNFNLIYNQEPEKGLAVNGVMGLTFEHQFYKQLWFIVGGYRHIPLYLSQNKYSLYNAMIGVRLRLKK